MGHPPAYSGVDCWRTPQQSLAEPRRRDEAVGGPVKPGAALEPDEATPLISAVRPAAKSNAPERLTCGLDRRFRFPKRSVQASPQRLLVPFLIYCIAMGAVAVPKLNVLLALMCVQYEEEVVAQRLGSDQICNAPSINVRMGRFMMCANIVSGVGCAFSSPRMGALSDRYERKPLLAFSALGLLFGDVISIAAGWFPHRISVYWVLLEFGIGGLTGSFVATMVIIQTYAADCTEGEARVSMFGQLHACMYLGVALGPAAGGLFVRMVGSGNMLSVFYAASLCHAAFIDFVLFGIKYKNIN